MVLGAPGISKPTRSCFLYVTIRVNKALTRRISGGSLVLGYVADFTNSAVGFLPQQNVPLSDSRKELHGFNFSLEFESWSSFDGYFSHR